MSAALKWCLAGLLALALVSLVASMVNVMTPWLVIPLAGIATVLIARYLPDDLAGPVSAPVGLALAVIVVGFAALGVMSPHEHVLGGRDPGTYVGTAAWISQRGGLWMDVGDPVFADLDVAYETLGFPAIGSPDLLRPQFLHLFPSLLAVVASIGGFESMFMVAPVVAAIGLLALYGFARSVLGDWASLVVTILTAITFPFFFLYRAPYTEILTFTYLFGGLWALERAMTTRSLHQAAGAGLLLGGVLATRIDGVLVLLGLTSYLAYLQWSEGDPESEDPADTREAVQLVEVTWRVSVVILVLGFVDGVIYSPAYLSDHGRLMGSVLTLTLAINLFGHRLGPVFRRHRQGATTATAVLLALFFVYSGLIRPYVAAPTRDDIYGISGLQQAAGVAVEPMRSYAELSLHWLSWYVGIPLLVVGLVSLVFVVRRLMGGGMRTGGVFVAIMSVATVVYVVRPSVNPDHIWAMRRFLPLVIPGIMVLVVYLWQENSPRLGRWKPLATLVAAAVAMVTVSPQTVAVGTRAELAGSSVDLMSTCDTLGDKPVVLFVGRRATAMSQIFAPALRGWCGAAVAAEGKRALDDADIELVASRTARESRPFWLVGNETNSGRDETLFSGSYEYLELTLFEPPADWLPLTITIEGFAE